VAAGWTQVEVRHHPLGTLVVDAQVQRHPPMSIGRMLPVDGFDLLLEGLLFGGLLQRTVDVLAIKPQCCRTHGLDPGATDYFDFFAGAYPVSTHRQAA